MYGKHSLAASVVAMGGPAGPRYYPESLSAIGAKALAESLRASGTPAVAVPVHLRISDPGELLAMPRPQLWGVAKTDPFDTIEADVLEQRDRESAGDVPRGSSEAEPTAEADDTADRLERIHDAIGRLALLEYSVEQARDDEQRLAIYRQMHATALPLAGDIEPLLEADSGGDDARVEEDPHDPDDDDAIARGFAVRILDPDDGTGWWSPSLVSPRIDPTKLAAKFVESGRKARIYDVAVNLDRGTVQVKPLPWWTGEAEQGDEANEEAEQTVEEDEPERLGDESTFLGSVSFERSLNQWTVWLAFVDFGSSPQLVSACGTLDEAWEEAKRWRDDPEHAHWAAIIVGPGDGPVSVERLAVWPDHWTVLTGEGERIACEGYPELEHHARRNAEILTDRCPIITAAYRPAPEGGAQ